LVGLSVLLQILCGNLSYLFFFLFSKKITHSNRTKVLSSFKQEMKFFHTLVILASFLLMVKGNEKKDIISRRLERQSTTPYFEQLLGYYLNLFQTKLQSNTMNKNDEKILGFLLDLIQMRKKAIAEEEMASTSYWHLREGRSERD
jgi:Trk-type K+ transport system membrane component